MRHAPSRPLSTLAIDPQGLQVAKQRAAAAAEGLEQATEVTSAPVAGLGRDGQRDSRVTPSDSTGAIGPDRYIQTVNLRFGIYDRSGTVISQGNLSTLAGIPDDPTLGPCLSDPQVIWDQQDQRFYYSVLDVCANALAIGFSRTATPADGSRGSWCKYEGFHYGFSLPDYPKLGDSGDLLLIGVNVFVFGLLYQGSDVNWIDKASLAAPAGQCPDPGAFHAGSITGLKTAAGEDASTPVPANGIDGSSTAYVVAAPDAATAPPDAITLFDIAKNATGGVSATRRTIPVPQWSVPAPAPQKRATKTIDTNDGRFTMSVAAVDPSLTGSPLAVWTTHAAFGGAGSEQRWYELDTSTGAVARSGVATSPSLYVYNGAVSPDRAVSTAGGSFGDAMVMGFTTSSSKTFPAIRMVSRIGSDPQSGFVLVVISPGKNVDGSCSPTCRWGDYAGASPDPVATGGHGQVWLTNMYNRKSLTPSDVDWKTRIWQATP